MNQLMIDLSVGETELVASSLNLNQLTYTSSPESRMYQSVGGLPSLVHYLEDKYQKYAVITAGCKQGIHASLHYMEYCGKTVLNRQEPHWLVFNNTFSLYNFKLSADFSANTNSFNFVVSPNNPDGKIWNQIIENYTIHDAAYNLDYYTDSVLKDIGDIELYSFSKMLGISGTRVGFCLTRDKAARDYISDYVEEMTVGVSAAAQHLALEGIKILDASDTSSIKATLSDNKIKLIEALKPYGDFVYADGIFLYGQLNKSLPTTIGVASYPDGYVRINCCYNADKISQVVELLK